METYQIEEGAGIYYLTFTVIEWLPVFIAEEPCLIITDSLNFCHQQKGLRIHAFVIILSTGQTAVFTNLFILEVIFKPTRITYYTYQKKENYSYTH